MGVLRALPAPHLPPTVRRAAGGCLRPCPRGQDPITRGGDIPHGHKKLREHSEEAERMRQ